MGLFLDYGADTNYLHQLIPGHVYLLVTLFLLVLFYEVSWLPGGDEGLCGAVPDCGGCLILILTSYIY